MKRISMWCVVLCCVGMLAGCGSKEGDYGVLYNSELDRYVVQGYEHDASGCYWYTYEGNKIIGFEPTGDLMDNTGATTGYPIYKKLTKEEAFKLLVEYQKKEARTKKIENAWEEAPN